MDTSFIAKHNVDNIYEYINADIVRNHSFDLNTNDKYKKIVKKLVKTIYNNIKDNTQFINYTINDFNSIVQDKCMPFLIKDIKKHRNNEIKEVKADNFEFKDNFNLNTSIKLNNTTKEKKSIRVNV